MKDADSLREANKAILARLQGNQDRLKCAVQSLVTHQKADDKLNDFRRKAAQIHAKASAQPRPSAFANSVPSTGLANERSAASSGQLFSRGRNGRIPQSPDGSVLSQSDLSGSLRGPQDYTRGSLASTGRLPQGPLGSLDTSIASTIPADPLEACRTKLETSLNRADGVQEGNDVVMDNIKRDLIILEAELQRFKTKQVDNLEAGPGGDTRQSQMMEASDREWERGGELSERWGASGDWQARDFSSRFTGRQEAGLDDSYTADPRLNSSLNRSVTFNQEDTVFGGTTDSSSCPDHTRSSTPLAPRRRSFTAPPTTLTAALPPRSILKKGQPAVADELSLDELQQTIYGPRDRNLNFSYSRQADDSLPFDLDSVPDDSFSRSLIESQGNLRSTANRALSLGTAAPDNSLLAGLFEGEPGQGQEEPKATTGTALSNRGIKGLDAEGRRLKPNSKPDVDTEDVYSTMLEQLGNTKKETVPVKSAGAKKGRRRLPAKDQAMLGYDWIAGMLDAQSEPSLGLSDKQLEGLKEFRAINETECVHPGSHVVTSYPLHRPDDNPVLKPLPPDPQHGCIHVYHVDERLFTTPVNRDVAGRSVCPICHVPRPKPTKETPGFVRVSIPKSAVKTPYRPKPHRRRSFDGADSMALKENCLAGWKGREPASLPPARSVGLRQPQDALKQQLILTVTEAEEEATTAKQQQLRLRARQLLTQSNVFRRQAEALKSTGRRAGGQVHNVSGYWPDEVLNTPAVTRPQHA